MPDPNGTVKLTVPPSASGSTSAGAMPVTAEVHVMVLTPGLVHVSVSKLPPGVIVGCTLNDAGL